MALIDAVRVPSPTGQRQVLFSPVIDFLGLGGGSLLLLPLFVWIVPDDLNPRLFGVGLILSAAINHPHFAHSYQIFYRTFRAVAFDAAADMALRLRYWWAGVAVPVLLVLFFAAALGWGNATAFGYAGNAMTFLVGWHYVKQGYGVLMVDAALRRSFLEGSDRRILLVNSFACWIASWLAVNKIIAQRDIWGFSYAAIDLPIEILWGALGLVAVTTLASIGTLVRFARAYRGAVPWNGIVGYVAALYPWVFLIREPVLVFLIPSMHALQYLLVVWRYQLNVEAAMPATRRFEWQPPILARPSLRIARFVLLGMALGWFGFCGLPSILDTYVPYDHAEYGNTMFVFVLFVLINVHHYFIDHAMWRKENPHTLPYLFVKQ